MSIRSSVNGGCRFGGWATILVSAALLMSCSSGAATQPASTATIPPRITLPGESTGDASNRLLSDCYAKYGIKTVKSGAGILSDLNEGTTPTRSIQDIVDDCNGTLNSSGLNTFAPLTDEQLRARYQLEVAWHDCIISQGYAIGPIVSQEQYVAAAGQLILFPGYAQGVYGVGQEALDALDIACPQPA
jgi:hypothetical protein